MRFASSIFGQLLEVIDRRQFQRIVDRHAGDAYDKRCLFVDGFGRRRGLTLAFADRPASAQIGNGNHCNDHD